MGYNLLINGVYLGYNPLTNHFLTSWDIQVYILGSNVGRKRGTWIFFCKEIRTVFHNKVWSLCNMCIYPLNRLYDYIKNITQSDLIIVYSYTKYYLILYHISQIMVSTSRLSLTCADSKPTSFPSHRPVVGKGGHQFWSLLSLDIQGHRNWGSVWLDPKKHTPKKEPQKVWLDV